MIPPSRRQAELIWLAATGLAIAVLVGLVVALVWGLGRVVDILSPVLWPLAVAGVVAYLLDPVVDWFERKRFTRPRAIVCVFALALVIVGSLFGSVVPQLVSETRELANRVPGYATKLEKQIEDRFNNPPPWLQKLQKFLKSQTTPPAPAAQETSGTPTDTISGPGTAPPAPAAGTNAPPVIVGLFDKDTLQTAAGGVAGVLRKTGAWLFGRVASWAGVLTGIALIPVYAFYFLLEKDRISSRWTDYLPLSDSKFKDELVFVLNSVNDYLIAFFRGQVLVAICDGILYGIGFLIIGLPYALLIGFAAMILTIIPFIGAIIICFTSLIIAVVQFGDWLHPLLVLLVFGITQTLEGLVISPKILGNRVGLHPLAIIISVMVGTTLLGGVLGGVLAIPLAAALRVLMFRYIWTRSPPQKSESASR